MQDWLIGLNRIEPDVGMPEVLAQRFFIQLICGLEYLHKKGVSHRYSRLLSSVVEPFHFGPAPAPASQDGGSGSSSSSSSSSSPVVHNLLLKKKFWKI